MKRHAFGCSVAGFLMFGAFATARAEPARAEPAPVEPATRPALLRASGPCKVEGHIGRYLAALTDNWLLRAPADNPAMLDMFRDRDKEPYRGLLPWSGEFAGKYLTAGTQVLRVTGDERLRAHLRDFVGKLVALQAEDGYLGPFPKQSRLVGLAPNAGHTWDAWGHYHVMLGLLLWHEQAGDDKALACATRIGDLLCDKFLGPDKNIVSELNAEMNHAVAHGLALLYRRTGGKRYLDLAREVVDEFALDGAGDYLRVALGGGAFYQTRKPRWESLHPIMALAELYWITGDDNYRKGFEQLWRSIAQFDRHNNGGFSSGEQAQGNPYHPGAIETCCTIAWMAMTVEMLKLGGDSLAADELELSTLNQIVGLHHPGGAWCTYNTPMDGLRTPSTVDIAFQKRPGSEQLNCCSVNAARGFGLLGEWALMKGGENTLVLNWYGPCTLTGRAGDVNVTLTQETDYPRDGRVVIRVEPERPETFALKLRIPRWSAATRVSVNGEALPNPQPGSYLAIDRKWQPGDSVTLDLDLSPHFWAGERECAGKTSVYRGPLLLAYDFGGSFDLTAPREPWRPHGDLWAANVPGAAIEATFEGDGVCWLGRKFDDAGRARVEIDGKEVAVVDQFGPGRDLPFSWEHTGLGPGRHTIRLTILEDKDPQSKGRFINVVGFGPLGALAALNAKALDMRVLPKEEAPGPFLTVDVAAEGGRRARLIDFGSAGYFGPANDGRTRYASWLNVKGVQPAPFDPKNPLRTNRP